MSLGAGLSVKAAAMLGLQQHHWRVELHSLALALVICKCYMQEWLTAAQ